MSTDPLVSTSTASDNSETEAAETAWADFMESQEAGNPSQSIATPIEQSTKFLAIIDVFTAKKPQWTDADTFLKSAKKQESKVESYKDLEKENIVEKLHACNLSKLLLLQNMLSAWKLSFGGKIWSYLRGGEILLTQEQQEIMDKIDSLVDKRREVSNSIGIAAYQIANNGCHTDAWGGMSEEEQNLWIASAETMTVEEMQDGLQFVHNDFKQPWEKIKKEKQKDKLPKQKVGKGTSLAEYKAKVLTFQMDDDQFLTQLSAKSEWNKCLQGDETSFKQLTSFLKTNAFYADKAKTRQHFEKIEEEFVKLHTPSTSKFGKLVQYIIGAKYDTKWEQIKKSIKSDPLSGKEIKKFNKETEERSQLPVEGDTIKLKSNDGATSSKYEVKGVQEMQAKEGVGTKRFFQVNLQREPGEAPVKGFANGYSGHFELGIFPLTLTVRKDVTFEVIFDPKKLNTLDKIENAMEQVKTDFNSEALCDELCKSLTTDFCTTVPGCKLQKGWNPFGEGRCVPGQSITTKATESNHRAKMLTSQQVTHLDNVINTLIHQQTSKGFRMAAILQKMLD